MIIKSKDGSQESFILVNNIEAAREGLSSIEIPVIVNDRIESLRIGFAEAEQLLPQLAHFVNKNSENRGKWERIIK